MTFPLLDETTAPEGALDSLATTKKNFAMIPNVEKVMALAPQLLSGYAHMWDLFETTTFTPVERQGTVGRFPNPILRPPPELVYATVHKHRENGRVVKVDRRLIYGTEPQLRRALKDSPLSSTVNTSYVERYNGTARHRNSRQVRKTYAFSKDWELHEHQSHLSMVGYNFCWTPRTLTRKAPEGHRQRRSPDHQEETLNRSVFRALLTRPLYRAWASG